MKKLSSVFKHVTGAKPESGQAIILIALFMVVMLAMVGLAIDGGGLFLLWRDAQNAADSAALQAAYDRCTSPTSEDSDPFATADHWGSKGLVAADRNGFDNSGSSGGDNIVTVQAYPPNTKYTEVTIKAEKPAYFIQLVYGGALEVKATSIVYCKRAFDWGEYPGAIALGDCSCPPTLPPSESGNFENTPDSNFSLNWSGSTLDIEGGTHSNCDTDISAGTITQTDGTFESVEELDYPTSMSSTPHEDDVDPITEDPLSLDIDMYRAGGLIYNNVAIAMEIDKDGGGIDSTYTGAFNTAIWTPGHHDAIPRTPFEGLYFVDGNVELKYVSEAEWYGGTTQAHKDAWKGVTIVATGQINTPDLDDVVWQYYGFNPSGTGDSGIAGQFDGSYYPRILAYTNYNQFVGITNCNSLDTPSKSAINLQMQDGDTARDWWGVLYAPYGVLNWNGNGQWGKGAMVAVFIDWNAANTKFQFDPSTVPPRPPEVEYGG